MTTTPYPNAALTDICKQILDEWDLTPEQIANLAADIPGECEAICRKRFAVLRAAIDAERTTP